ncbi:MAG TPA: alanine--tRNA ligase [Steroidobacteraceae bacterium]|jgi:alanyl-tRNA synthetase|nr:alanine--tRNA ligase [Steroidobacteraceae bacterium]
MTEQLPNMSATQVRRAFLQFFADRGHTIVPSSSLVPGNDPTLLFTNAGMVQFKDVFLGKERRDYVRAASSQRCVRAGGKHNDLENVGYTTRHHTFFEMLGNFSFGDYFKREAIGYAWQFVTQGLKVPPSRLWVTVFRDDDEAARIWTHEIGVPAERVLRMGEKSNFWAMGDTGPCGPCSEIFYDHGPQVPGGPPGSPEEDGDRYVEIWNLVFMQYERAADGTLTPLPKPSVDTGAGLERLAAVMQGVHSNYDIDLFRDLIAAAAQLTGTRQLDAPSLRVIADHIRACSFLISDGVLPSNEGRGYVLRRIIRRAVRHGYKLGCAEPFFYKLVPTLVAVMGDAYPELVRSAAAVQAALRAEEERFAETLQAGMAQFDARMGATESEVPGSLVFLLHDTYGFPPDLTADIARERALTVDMAGYEREMEAQRERARAASRFGVDLRGGVALDLKSEFVGYDTEHASARVTALLRDGQAVQAIEAGERAEVVLDRTPFYAESGGQVGDSGELRGDAGVARFTVQDTRKRGAAYAHFGELSDGRLEVGQSVEAHIDVARREAIRLNHSATHLLHAALRQVLGRHVTQKGSLVAPDRLRFDFSHSQPVSAAELAQVEQLVNAQIRANAAAATRLMPYEEAVGQGAMALFGEKYDSRVRVLSIGDFSLELCGGTHVRRAGDIGLFHIVSESGVATGVRRIEAVTGQVALDHLARIDALLANVAGLVHGSRDEVAERVRDALDRIRTLEKENRTLRERLAVGGAGQDLAASAVKIDGVQVLAKRIDGADSTTLRAAVDQLKSRLGSAIIVLGTAVDSKVLLVAGVTADQTTRVQAGELIGVVAAQVGGRGNGRADFAQGGGTRPEALDEALAGVAGWVRQRLTHTH